MGNIVHLGASGARNVDTLFFMFGCNCYGFHKNHALTRYTKLVFLHLVGSMGLVHSGAPRA
jgi:hypothetical protein